MDNTAQQKFHFIEIYGYAPQMRLPYHMSDVALLYGGGGTTNEFFLSWLRGEAISSYAHSVLASVSRSTREALLAQSLLDQVGFKPGQVVRSFAEFLADDVDLGDVILATHSSEAGDFGVAFRVGDHGVLVANRVGQEPGAAGYFLPTLDLPPSIAAPFLLGLAALCARHGMKPGRFPLPLRDAVIIGQARLTADFTQPLTMPRKTLHRIQVEKQSVIFATMPEDIAARRLEAAELVQRGRTFEREMSVVSAQPAGKVVFCASGASAGALGQLGAWTAFFPEFRDESSILRTTSIWHRFAEDMLNKGGVTADLRLGHSTGRWAAQSSEPISGLLARLDHSGLEDDLAGAIREIYASHNELEAASAEGSIWQAWLVLGPVENVEKAIADAPLVEIIERRGPLESVIAGFPSALDDVMLELLNSPRMHATELDFNVPLHSAAACLHAAELRRIFAIDGLDKSETIEAEIEAAWAAGGRVFIDLGPRAGYAHWIPRVLEGRDFQVIALDPGMHGPSSMIEAFVRLSALGLPVSLSPFEPIFEAHEWSRFNLPEQKKSADWVQEAREIQANLLETHLAFLGLKKSAFEAFIDAHQAGLRALENP